MSEYTKPVVGDRFFAREDILQILLKSASDIKQGYRHNIAVAGRGLIGKSSLLLHFLGQIRDDSGLIPIYINLKGMDLQKFAENFVSMMLYHAIRKRTPVKTTDDLDYLEAACGGLFPKSREVVRRIRSCIRESDFDEAYSALWDLCVVINAESGQFPVVVLDEFDMISSFPVRNAFMVLGRKIMVQQRTLFVVSSSSAVRAKKILFEKLSLLFGGFRILDVGAFSQEQTKGFLKARCKGIILPDILRDFLVFFTGGHPFYLSLIAQRFDLARQHSVRRLSARYISTVIAELFFQQGGLINQFFIDMIHRLNVLIKDQNIFDILRTLLATGRVNDIVKRHKISRCEVSDILNHLQDFGVITKSGSLYAITDPAFRMWLQVKARPTNLYFDFCPADDMPVYMKEVRRRIEDFISYSRQSFDEKIIDLIRSFKNDQFFIDQRVRVLPSLEIIRKDKLGTDDCLISRHANKRWLILVSSKRITEEYAATVFDRLRELKDYKARVVLISSDGIDANAKLMAKQRHIWTWDREDIRNLSQFYKGSDCVIA